MNDQLMVNVSEFQNDEERHVKQDTTIITVYDDGTVEFGVDISGKNHRVYLRFFLADIVRLAITSENREEAP